MTREALGESFGDDIPKALIDYDRVAKYELRKHGRRKAYFVNGFTTMAEQRAGNFKSLERT